MLGFFLFVLSQLVLFGFGFVVFLVLFFFGYPSIEAKLLSLWKEMKWTNLHKGEKLKFSFVLIDRKMVTKLLQSERILY